MYNTAHWLHTPPALQVLPRRPSAELPPAASSVPRRPATPTRFQQGPANATLTLRQPCSKSCQGVCCGPNTHKCTHTSHTRACSSMDDQSGIQVQHAGGVSSEPYGRRPDATRLKSLESACPHACTGTSGKAAGCCIGQPDMAADIEGVASSDRKTHTT